MTSSDDAKRLASLFRGFSGGYGTYYPRLLGKAEGKQKVPQTMRKNPPTVYVQATHCQCAQMFLSLFHTYGAAGATPLPHVDIHLLLHRLGTTAVNHF